MDICVQWLALLKLYYKLYYKYFKYIIFSHVLQFWIYHKNINFCMKVQILLNI